MKKLKFILFIFSSSFLVTACQNNSKSKQQNIGIPTKTEKEAAPKPDLAQTVTEPLKSKDMVYAWVDKLNIRNTPNTNGKVVDAVDSKDPLEFTGERSKTKEEIVLRGVTYDESWLKIITPDKIEGWVFGGAVKRKDEKKGNDIITDEKFDFPHFGKFDFKNWKKLSFKDESEGDAEIGITTYKKGNQILEISKVEVGDYGYSRTYKLLDADKKILKERELRFSADASPRQLFETVKDFTSNPAKEYFRTQKIKKHHSQLNVKPEMVNGSWSQKTMK